MSSKEIWERMCVFIELDGVKESLSRDIKLLAQKLDSSAAYMHTIIHKDRLEVVGLSGFHNCSTKKSTFDITEEIASQLIEIYKPRYREMYLAKSVPEPEEYFNGD